MLTDFAEHKEIADAISQIAQPYLDRMMLAARLRNTADELGDEVARIKQLFGHILTHYPDSDRAMWARRGIAFVEIHLGNFEAAEREIEILRADYPEHKELTQAFFYLGNDFRRMKLYDKARACYRYASEMGAGTSYALQSLGSLVKLLMYEGKVFEAETALQQLWTDYDNQSGLAESLLGISPWLRHYDQYDLAIQLNVFILNVLSPSDEITIRTEIELAKAEESLGLDGYVLETIRYLIEEFAGNPNLPRLIFFAGEEYYEKGFGGENEGNPEQAHTDFFHAIRIWDVVIHDLPEDTHYTPIAVTFSGICFGRLGDYETAISYSQKVIDTWPHYKKGVTWARKRIEKHRRQLARQNRSSR